MMRKVSLQSSVGLTPSFPHSVAIEKEKIHVHDEIELCIVNALFSASMYIHTQTPYTWK